MTHGIGSSGWLRRMRADADDGIIHVLRRQSRPGSGRARRAFFEGTSSRWGCVAAAESSRDCTTYNASWLLSKCSWKKEKFKLQNCIIVHWNVLKCIVMHWDALGCIGVHWNVLQCNGCVGMRWNAFECICMCKHALTAWHGLRAMPCIWMHDWTCTCTICKNNFSLLER